MRIFSPPNKARLDISVDFKVELLRLEAAVSGATLLCLGSAARPTMAFPMPPSDDPNTLIAFDRPSPGSLTLAGLNEALPSFAPFETLSCLTGLPFSSLLWVLWWVVSVREVEVVAGGHSDALRSLLLLSLPPPSCC